MSTIQLSAVGVGGLLGALLMLVTIFSNQWRAHDKNINSRFLLSGALIALVSCLADPLCSIADGRPGRLAYFVNYVGNWWLFVAVLITTLGWVFFLANYLGVRLHRVHAGFLIFLFATGAIMLLLNFSRPIIFYVDENNLYHRGDSFWVMEVMQLVFLVDGVVLYNSVRRSGGMLKFFPINIFMIPVAIGVALQTVFYGISTIWPCIAIAISGIAASMQNQLLFRDKLTGLYNRFYLDNLNQEIRHAERAHFTILMLDLNNFKSINDTFGHSVGDDALIQTGRILQNTVGKMGTAIRYAGDEFLVILNSQDPSTVSEYVDLIRKAMSDFNRSGIAGYTLSAAIGAARLDLNRHTIDELMNEVDAQMFLDKRIYHDNHPDEGR